MLVAGGEELEVGVVPSSKTRVPEVEGLSEVFLVFEEAERRASACASVRVPPPSLAKVRMLSPPVTEAGDGVGDAAQVDIGDGGPIGREVESDGAAEEALLMTSFSLDPS